MLRNRYAGIAVIGSAVLGLMSCSFSPRNNTALNHITDTISWSGAFPSPNQQVFLLHGDGSQPFGLFDFEAEATTSSTVSITDGAGVNWYSWGASSVALRQDASHWQVIGPHQLAIKIRTVTSIDFTNDATSGPLPVFDSGSQTDQCISNNANAGGIQIISQCQSSSQGIVTLTAPCGTRGEACCGAAGGPNIGCDGGLACSGNDNGVLGTCLGAAGATCSSDSDCATGGTCQSGVCSFPPTQCAACVDRTCECGTESPDQLCAGHGGVEPGIGCVQQT